MRSRRVNLRWTEERTDSGWIVDHSVETHLLQMSFIHIGGSQTHAKLGHNPISGYCRLGGYLVFTGFSVLNGPKAIGVAAWSLSSRKGLAIPACGIDRSPRPKGKHGPLAQLSVISGYHDHLPPNAKAKGYR